MTLFTDGGGGGDVCVYWVLFSVCVCLAFAPGFERHPSAAVDRSIDLSIDPRNVSTIHSLHFDRKSRKVVT